ncbi:hypothetical protein D3C71_77390 [compost metagenome]
MRAILTDKLGLYQQLIAAVEDKLRAPSAKSKLFVSLGRHPRGDSLVFELTTGHDTSVKIDAVYIPQPGPIGRLLLQLPDGSAIFLRVLRDQRNLHAGQRSLSIAYAAEKLIAVLCPREVIQPAN